MNDDLFPAPPPPPPPRSRPPGVMPDITLLDQIKEVRRELAMRRNVYPKWVARGSLKQSDADYRIDAMCEALRTLEDLHLAGVVGNGPRP